jgi:hypothetical protein
MKKAQFIMAGLAVILLAFIMGAWGGLRQWWETLSLRRRALYIGLAFCALAGVISHFTGVNPLLILAGLIFLRLIIYGIQFIVWLK